VTIPGQIAPPSDQEADPPPRGLRRSTLVVVAAIAAVIVSVTAWWMWTSHVTGSIAVRWADEPTCTGTSLRPDGHTIEARPGMSCTITVTVRNDGPVAVHLDNALLPFFGPDGGAVVRAGSIDGVRPEGIGSEIDATMALDHKLASGESWTFRTRAVFRDDGCTAAGTMTIDGWPTVRAEYLGRSVDVSADRRFTLHASRQNPGCTR
jgi:hypothetical protein